MPRGRKKKQVKQVKQVEQKQEKQENFYIGVVDSAELKFQNIKDNGLVVSIVQNDNEIWFDFNLTKNKIVCKIPSRKTYPKTYEFTVNQFISLLSSKENKQYLVEV